MKNNNKQNFYPVYVRWLQARYFDSGRVPSGKDSKAVTIGLISIFFLSLIVSLVFAGASESALVRFSGVIMMFTVFPLSITMGADLHLAILKMKYRIQGLFSAEKLLLEELRKHASRISPTSKDLTSATKSLQMRISNYKKYFQELRDCEQLEPNCCVHCNKDSEIRGRKRIVQSSHLFGKDMVFDLKEKVYKLEQMCALQGRFVQELSQADQDLLLSEFDQADKQAKSAIEEALATCEEFNQLPQA